MSERKIKPPRPPAPNLASKKRTLASTTISFKYNPLMGSDDEDDLLEDGERGISLITSRARPLAGVHLVKSASLDGPAGLAKSGDPKPSSPGQPRHSLDAGFTRRKEEAASSKPAAKVREPESRAHFPIASSPPTNEGEKRRGQGVPPSDSTDARPAGKPSTTITGLMKVPSAVLTEDGEQSVLPTDSEEAATDPLSFLDKVMEEQFEREERAEGSKRERDLKLAASSRAGSLATTHRRSQSLDSDGYKATEDVSDSLDIDPCYYTVPAPSELHDEAVVQRSSVSSSGSPHTRHRRGAPASKNMSLSLSGLLATSKDEAEEPPENDVSMSTRSSRSTLDSPDYAKHDPGADFDPQLKSPSSPLTKGEVVDSATEAGVSVAKSEPEASESGPPALLLCLLSLVLFFYFQFPLSRYMTGFFAGVLLTFYSMLFLIWLTVPSSSSRRREEEGERRAWGAAEDCTVPLVIPGVPLSASVVRSKEQKRVVQKPIVEEESTQSKGWMNELPTTYDPDNYHSLQTQSVFVRLDGYSLRLSRPRHNIPRRAMFDEPANHKVEFVHQRHYDMRDSKVYLLPDGLVKKRLWSKKYPICIELPKKGLSVARKEPTDVAPDDGEARSLGFDCVQREECDDRVLYLFTRTSRDKEEWFWKLSVAARFERLERGRRPVPTLSKGVFLVGGELTRAEAQPPPTPHSEEAAAAARKGTIDFYRFMTKVLPKDKESKDGAAGTGAGSSGGTTPAAATAAATGATAAQGAGAKSGSVTYASPARRPARTEGNGPAGSPVDWVNGLVGRLFWDFLREESWAQLVKTKLQKKLSKLKVPYFLEELKITDIDLGVNAPQLRRVSRPRLDERGLWVDLEVAYAGSCTLSMTTKVNLWRLGKGDKFDKEMTEISPVKKETKEKERTPSLAALDSDVEDSAESSDEDADDAFVSQEAAVPSAEPDMTKGSGKIMRLVNKIASSKYFQSATQNKYIKRAMDEVSNTPVELTVEVKQLRGPLSVNIPPPPTDRFWYGFREKPYLWLSAKPKLGARQVTITHITDYIEKKLELEFQKVFVLPNMDDVPLPIMTSDPFDNFPR